VRTVAIVILGLCLLCHAAVFWILCRSMSLHCRSKANTGAPLKPWWVTVPELFGRENNADCSPRILLLFSNLTTLFLMIVFFYCFLIELNEHTHHDNTVLLKKKNLLQLSFFSSLQQEIQRRWYSDQLF
jgi:hypothetical protein